jgi:phytanoyl-CoA hydroxylase
MYIFKGAKIGGEVLPHTDNTYLFTNPLSCIGFWLALHDATTENGCLWGVPGS